MAEKIVARDKEHLVQLIKETIEKEGPNCDLNFIDVSQVKDMSDLFSRTHFTDFTAFNGNINQWDVSNVTNMRCMFFGSQFNGDISSWDVSNVKNMECMFYHSSFRGDICKWNISYKTAVGEIFEGVEENQSQANLEHVKVPYYQLFVNSAKEGKVVPIDKKHLQNIIRASIGLYGPKCDLNFIDVSKITDMSQLFAKSIFKGNISQWDVSNVTNMSSMFCGCSFDGDISQWDVSKVTDMSGMFSSSSFKGNISQWNVFNVINMDNMFDGPSLEHTPSWYKEKVVAEDRNHLEKLVKDAIEKDGLNCNLNFIDVSKVQDMSYLFSSDETLRKFNGNIRGWNISNVTNMVGMFAESDFAGDLRQWESKFADKVDRTGMFYNAKKFTKEHAKTFAPWCSDGNGSEWEEPIVIPLEINDLVL